MTRSVLSVAIWAASAALAWGGITLEPDGYHVRPGDRIQEALDQAATNTVQKTVWVHAGLYRPESKRQALIGFNRRHDGIRLVALGDVTLTAARRVEAVTGLGTDSDIVLLRMPPSTGGVQACSRTVREPFED